MLLLCSQVLRKFFTARYFRCKVLRPLQKQPPRGVPRKRCSENMHQIYRKHPCQIAISIKLLCDVIEMALLHGCSPVNLLHIFRTPFTKNTSARLLLPLVFYLFEFNPQYWHFFSLQGENVLIQQLFLTREGKKRLRYLFKMAKAVFA